ncbi:dTDP-4-dehydrorhamnose 3,5-epimerase [Pendulispora rubella]|uniref:dTDP-4-dehydrorhamnose 3,5-epimerase n=1 Tax=Pendulispora rubella TaxID=2741070 RepID=A0ABZ2L1I1_9BACT
MKFVPLSLHGAYLIELERLEDERGFFARTWCAREFEAHGLNPRLTQCNLSQNAKRGTLRGMHFQAAPHEEAKLVTCVSGAIHDVIVDLRAGSPTYRQWIAVELRGTGATWRGLYVPEGFAHGFQTLLDDSLVFYQMSEFFAPESARGIRYDDPGLGIEWPIPGPIVSVKDRSYPTL